MSKKNYYIVEKNLNKINKGESTNFLDPSTFIKVTNKLPKNSYKVYYPYQESDKKIIYTDELPKIRILELTSYEELTHREILGSLFGLNIDSELFGDIIITNGHYYIMVMDSIYNLIINDYHSVGNKHIKIKEIPLDILDNYHREYEKIELIVTSLRIDNVISSIIGTSRNTIKQKFNDGEIVLNYEICHKTDYNLNIGDIFSIHKYGKYRFDNIVTTTKKNKYLISCLKYK